MGSANNYSKHPLCDSVFFQLLLGSISTEVVVERQFYKCIYQFCRKKQHQTLPVLLALLYRGFAPKSRRERKS